ncbi:MAG: PPC domain-containing protein, partial [Gemmataceae bacterium]|nr:PPC domain-containing protein [Gemmataceae bacterium]
PAGGKAGTKIEVKLGGQDWTPDTEFFVGDKRVKLEVLTPPGPVLMHEPPYWFDIKSFANDPSLPREISARFTLPEGMPAGPIHWRVANANGAGNGGIFMVGNTPEILEDESLRTPQQLPDFPVTVSGRLKRIEEVDRYQFKSKISGIITCDLFARRLGSDFNGVIEVHDQNNRKVAEIFDTEGTDPTLTFTSEKDITYTVSIRDVDYRGFRSFTYRLVMDSGPRILAAIPAAGKRGQKQTIEFIGIGVATGKAKIESIKKEVAFPADEKLASFAYKLETPFGNGQSYSFPLSNFDEKTLGTELLMVPGAVTGRLTEAKKSDTYTFKGKKAELWTISCDTGKIGSNLDITLAVLGPDGKEIASKDDSSPSMDPELPITLPADGDYKIIVRDLSGKTKTPASVYRLVVDKTKTNFKLRTLPAASVPIGGTLALAIVITREAGFKEPVTLTFANLPEGVSVPANLIILPTVASLNVTLTCTKDAPASAVLAKITGTAKVAEQTITNTALAPLKGDLAARNPDSNLTESILVATTIKPPFKVKPVVADGGIRVHRGATYLPEIIIERNEGFKGEITLDMAGTQQRHRQGIRGSVVAVGPEVKKLSYPVFLPEWLETSRTSRIGLIAIAQIPDPKGKIRYVQAAMDGQITMSIEGAMLKLLHPSEELVVPIGAPFELTLKLAQSNKLKEPVNLELIIPDEIKGLVTFSPIAWPTNSDTLKIKVATKPEAKMVGLWVLTARVTTQFEKHPVVSETGIEVEFLLDKENPSSANPALKK